MTLGPRHVLMPAGWPLIKATYEAAGISCQELEIGELLKAASGMGCLTGILSRLKDTR